MSNLEVQIKPQGVTKRNLVDCFYAVVSSIKGICAKLDDDGGVPLTTYEANVFTALFNGSITNSRGEMVSNGVTGKEDIFFIMSPTGINNRSIIQCIYQIFDMMETLTEQCDTDTLQGSNYEALVYTAHYLWEIENEAGSKVGNSTTQWIRPGGIDEKNLVDILYAFVHSIHVLCDKLDDDTTVTDTDYEALWDTANILMQVQDSAGNIAGNALTTFNP
ncbi:MAG: hypothetical protein PHG61_08665 [Candidatus Marinimicrobia bacterium]|nr:hypothetical protein [Candidatus Neomarinimicrobiota bacterium]